MTASLIDVHFCFYASFQRLIRQKCYRINKQHKIWTEADVVLVVNDRFIVMRTSSGCQMPTCGKAHDPNFRRIDVPFGCTFTNDLDAALRIFHSDRGVQYACGEFTTLPDSHKNTIKSMSRKGNCWDNAVAESFFKTLKTELVYQNKHLERSESELYIFEYIEAQPLFTFSQ